MSAVEVLLGIIGLLLVALFGSTRLTKRAQTQRDDAKAEARAATKQAAIHEAAATATASVASSRLDNAKAKAEALRAVENARRSTQDAPDVKTVEAVQEPRTRTQDAVEVKNEGEVTQDDEAQKEEAGGDMDELLRLAAEQVNRTRSRGRLLDSAR